MKKSELSSYKQTVLVQRAGKEAVVKLDLYFYPDQPCLTFPEQGHFTKAEPYFLTEADINAFRYDAGSNIIRSPLTFD